MEISNTTEPSFMAAYARFLAACAGNQHEDNYDWRRFGSEGPPARSLREELSASLGGLLKRVGLVRIPTIRNLLTKGLRFVEPNAAELEWLYRRLADDESRECLIQVVAFRALGFRYVKLPFNRPEYWRMVEEMENSAGACETIDPGFMGWQLPKINLRNVGYPIDLFLRPVSAVTQFVEQQYRCVAPQGNVEVQEDDIVIDAGGCWGDTALYFAARAGERGKVASFEFLPENLKIYQRNLDLNPELAGRIRVLEHPVWSSSDEELFLEGNGPGTSVCPVPQSPNARSIRTLSIDRVLERGDLPRVDFIKMDIEGAELPALRGAEATIRRFRPKLAITVYHSLPDFWEIPQYLDSLGAGYRFHLRHFTIHSEETVLFAQV